MSTRALAFFLVFSLVPACGPSASAPPEARTPAPLPAKVSAASARYLVLHKSFVERREDGLDLVIAGGRRLLVEGPRVVGRAADETELSAGFALPSWVRSEARRYLFWKNNDLYAAPRWDGELERIATLRAAPSRAFDWLDGAGVVVPGGAFVVKASGAIAPFPVAATTLAVAASERRALRVSLLGRAELSLDGGASFRDLSAELGQVRSLEVRGDAIVARLSAGGERFIDSSGRVSQTPPLEGSVRHKKPRDDEPDMWPDGKNDALRLAVASGVPLSDGGAVIAGSGFVGRFDLETLRTTSAVPMPGVSVAAECAPIRLRDAVVVVCSSETHATVINLDGAPRIERSFDRAGAPDLDRFVGDMESALGYLGPCDGTPPSLPPADVSASSSYELANGWSSRSPVLCVRKSGDEWVEHRLDPVDASDVLGWIPRPDGGAVAIIARQGSLLEEGERVSVRGGLRVVRVARNEPPLSLPSYSYDSSELLELSMWIDAQGDIRAWLPSNSGTSSVVPVRIDRSGHASVLPMLLGADHVAAAGRFALARARNDENSEGGVFETTDGGESFRAVEPPPDARASFDMPSSCSALGCVLGSFARVGWQPDAPRASSSVSASRRLPEARRAPRRPSAPLVRLRCAFDGPPQGRAQSESFGFGVTPSPVPRGSMPVTVGHAGVLLAPWAGRQRNIQGDVELGWLTPFDPAASIKRVTIPVDKISPELLARRMYQLELGYVLAPKGELSLLPVGPPHRCMSELLEQAGMVRSIGACAAVSSVAVDLGGHLFAIHPSGGSLVISRGRGLSSSAGAGHEALPGALRELGRSSLSGGSYGFSFGAGEREGAPVVVIMDVAGRARIAPIDTERGELGAEEPLAALTEAKLGDHPSCADRSAGGAEATVLLPLKSEIGLVTDELAGVTPSGTFALARLRWSSARACLDAVEIRVRDERFDPNLSSHYDPPGTLRKLIARFSGPSRGASLALIMQGAEVRQRLACTGLVAEEGP